MSAYTLHLGDCLEVMPGIPSGSVDAIIADWPYGQTACKWDSVIPIAQLWKECKRVIKPGGAIVLFGSQPFTSALVVSNLGWFKYEWIWDKKSPTGGATSKKRPMKAHESILVFSDSAHIYNPQFGKWTDDSIARMAKKRYVALPKTEQMHSIHLTKNKEDKLRDGKTPLSVIRINALGRTDKKEGGLHPTQKPVALIEYLIKTYTNPGDLVLDNTMGSGSTGEACLRTERRFVGIEKDPGYFEIAQTRLERVERELREARIAKERQPYLMETVSQCP